MNLANALLSQFEQNGGVEVLDESISLCHERLDLCPPGHRYREHAVKSLVQHLEKRHEVTGDDQDLGEIQDLQAELDVPQCNSGGSSAEG